MQFFDVIAITMSILGFFLSLQGLWLVCRALWPDRVAAAAGRCRRNGIKCLLVGVAVTAVVSAVSAGVGAGLGAPGQLIAWVVFGVYLMYAGVGMAGLASHVGQRLASPSDADQPWRATVRGGIVLELAYLIPIIGWFGLLPLSVIYGAGATTLSFFKPKPDRDTVLPLPPFHGGAMDAAIGGRFGERVGMAGAVNGEAFAADRVPPPPLPASTTGQA